MDPDTLEVRLYGPSDKPTVLTRWEAIFEIFEDCLLHRVDDIETMRHILLGALQAKILDSLVLRTRYTDIVQSAKAISDLVPRPNEDANRHFEGRKVDRHNVACLTQKIQLAKDDPATLWNEESSDFCKVLDMYKVSPKECRDRGHLMNEAATLFSTAQHYHHRAMLLRPAAFTAFFECLYHFHFFQWRPRVCITETITRQPSAPGMIHSSLHLPFIAHLPQPVAFARCQAEVDLHPNGMQEQRHPQGHSEVYAQARSNLFRLTVAESRLDDDESIVGRAGLGALGVQRLEFLGFGIVNGTHGAAFHGGVVFAGLTDDEGSDDHNQPQGHDGGEVEHGPQHPGAVLFDLETLDVVVGQCNADGAHDGEDTDAGLSGEGATESTSHDHNGADVAKNDEDDDGVTIDAVEHEDFVADDGKELPRYENASGEDGGEVDGDADAVDAIAVPEPFAW